MQDRIMIDKEVQTDIKDIRSDLVVVNPNMIVVQSRQESPVSQHGTFQTSPFYIPPPIFSSMEASNHTSPSVSPFHQLGWWNGFPPGRF